MIEVLEAAELADDALFATNVQRVRNRAECDRELAQRTISWSSADLAQRLAEVGVPAADVRQLSDVVDHPQLAARGRWRTVRTENASIPALLPPVTFRDFEAVMGDVPALGQHTLDLLREIGVDDVRARGLLSDDVVYQPRQRPPRSA